MIRDILVDLNFLRWKKRFNTECVEGGAQRARRNRASMECALWSVLTLLKRRQDRRTLNGLE
jgi:hypothetical protein